MPSLGRPAPAKLGDLRTHERAVPPPMALATGDRLVPVSLRGLAAWTLAATIGRPVAEGRATGVMARLALERGLLVPGTPLPVVPRPRVLLPEALVPGIPRLVVPLLVVPLLVVPLLVVPLLVVPPPGVLEHGLLVPGAPVPGRRTAGVRSRRGRVVAALVLRANRRLGAEQLSRRCRPASALISWTRRLAPS